MLRVFICYAWLTHEQNVHMQSNFQMTYYVTWLNEKYVELAQFPKTTESSYYSTKGDGTDGHKFRAKNTQSFELDM